MNSWYIIYNGLQDRDREDYLRDSKYVQFSIFKIRFFTFAGQKGMTSMVYISLRRKKSSLHRSNANADTCPSSLHTLKPYSQQSSHPQVCPSVYPTLPS